MGMLFDTVKDPKWSGMGHEMIAFTHYYIVENEGISISMLVAYHRGF
ncbi:MAG: hypothetical protein ACLR5T_00550 [Veillonella sp.]